jgi:hypothetical protein
MTINLTRDLLSPRFPQFDRIERDDCLLDQIQCDTGDVAGLFAIEPLARRIDQGDRTALAAVRRLGAPPPGSHSVSRLERSQRTPRLLCVTYRDAFVQEVSNRRRLRLA